MPKVQDLRRWRHRVGCGEGVNLPTEEKVWGCAPSPENFWNFDIQMVSFYAFRVLLFTIYMLYMKKTVLLVFQK